MRPRTQQFNNIYSFAPATCVHSLITGWIDRQDGQPCCTRDKVGGTTMASKGKTTTTPRSDGNPDRILIKRYGNRRLYNTETGSYVNYQELVKIIRDGHDVQVIDSRTKTDVTKAVLMQVILEEEKTE